MSKEFRPYSKEHQVRKADDFRAENEESAEKYHNVDPKPEKKVKEPRPRLKRTSIKKNYKPSGELEIFRQVALERGSRSEISGDRIHDITVSSVAHILSKKQYPKFRLKKENLVILTPEEHREYDQGSHEALRALPEWEWLFKKRDLLIEMYKLVE